MIGGGASGLLTAIQLLSQERCIQPRVYLVEKATTFGVGAAYSTTNPIHLLNTRAGNMSAFPNQPEHFVDWLAARHPLEAMASCSFVSREAYGEYLQALLRETAVAKEAAGRFYLVADEAISLVPDGKGFRIRLAGGRDLNVCAAVLATGNSAPAPPGIKDDGVLQSPSYVADPWTLSQTSSGNCEGAVLLLGTGLTMIDVALSLTWQGYSGPLIALSRRGLLPNAHVQPAHPSQASAPPLSANIRLTCQELRRLSTQAEAEGGSWHTVVDRLRPITAAYWRALPGAEKRRFLRHLRPFWDVHRHRLAPQVHRQISSLIQKGTLTLHKGRLRKLSWSPEPLNPVEVEWRPRAAPENQHLRVSMVVNCTGPGLDPRASPMRLLAQLYSAGLIVSDDLNLGIAVDSARRTMNAAGSANPALFAIGPITRGTFWEVTAIPDIRVEAASVARGVLRLLSTCAASSA